MLLNWDGNNKASDKDEENIDVIEATQATKEDGDVHASAKGWFDDRNKIDKRSNGVDVDVIVFV